MGMSTYLDFDLDQVHRTVVVVAACIAFLLLFVIRAPGRRAPRRLASQSAASAAWRVRGRGKRARALHPGVCIAAGPVRNTIGAPLGVRQWREGSIAVRINVAVVKLRETRLLLTPARRRRRAGRACCDGRGRRAAWTANAEAARGHTARDGGPVVRPTNRGRWTRARALGANTLAGIRGNRDGGFGTLE